MTINDLYEELTTPNNILSNFARQYAEAKAAETVAIEKRRAIAEQIALLVKHTAEGAKTYASDDWKVTVKVPLIRSMDWDKWHEVKERIPFELWPVELRPYLDEKGVKWLEANKPQIYAVLAEVLTVKPGAVQVTVSPVAAKGE